MPGVAVVPVAGCRLNVAQLLELMGWAVDSRADVTSLMSVT